jgi:Glyoxalase/Bleomycin resistance protein/Dioxygenase superfamily
MPMREPVFRETLQLEIVVRDLDATMRRYVDDYGIGPWEVYESNADNAEDFREYGQPVERSWRLAVATVGQVQWELIEPLDEQSVWRVFSPRTARASSMSPSPLRTQGGSVHGDCAVMPWRLRRRKPALASGWVPRRRLT